MYGQFMPGWKGGRGKPVHEYTIEGIDHLINLAEYAKASAAVFPGMDGDATFHIYLHGPVDKQPFRMHITVYPEDIRDVEIQRWEPAVEGWKNMVVVTHMEEEHMMPFLLQWIGYIRAGYFSRPIELI